MQLTGEKPDASTLALDGFNVSLDGSLARRTLNLRFRRNAASQQVDSVCALAPFLHGQEGDDRAGETENERDNPPAGAGAALRPHAGVYDIR